MDKKPTDSEIVKALEEYCKKYNLTYNGKQAKAILDLINRQRAEIERLNAEHDKNFEKWEILDKRTKERYAELYEEAKAVVRAEAYKECIEEAKEQCAKIPQYHFNLLNVQWYLDDLLKKKGLGENK